MNRTMTAHSGFGKNYRTGMISVLVPVSAENSGFGRSLLYFKFVKFYKIFLRNLAVYRNRNFRPKPEPEPKSFRFGSGSVILTETGMGILLHTISHKSHNMEKS